MPFIHVDDINLTIDDILLSFGIPRSRAKTLKSSLPRICEKTLRTMKGLIDPKILYRVLPVLSADTDGFLLDPGVPGKPEILRFGSIGLTKAIPKAVSLIVILITIGPELERKALELSNNNIADGYALDRAGDAALRSLSDAACVHFKKEYARRGLGISHPCDPGMDGWPAGQGQREIFSILDGAQAGVTLNSCSMMIPRKSITMVLGVGVGFAFTQNPCEGCCRRDICSYKVSEVYD